VVGYECWEDSGRVGVLGDLGMGLEQRRPGFILASVWTWDTAYRFRE